MCIPFRGKAFTEPLPSNGHLLWLHYSGFQAQGENTVTQQQPDVIRFLIIFFKKTRKVGQKGLSITGFLDFVYGPKFYIQENTTFRKLDLFLSSGEERELPIMLGPLERVSLNHPLDFTGQKTGLTQILLVCDDVDCMI
jgi:hypothetical protein